MSGTGKEGDSAIAYCRRKLTELNYTNPEVVIEQAINLMTCYNSLELKSTVVELKGNKDELIKLFGDIPISHHANSFDIRGCITVWIEKNFPLDAPIIKLNKTNLPPIYFEPFLNTRQSTVVYSPFYEWNGSKSTLTELIQSVCIHLKQVCLGWMLSARDQEDPNWTIPPRLTMPAGFQPFPLSSSPNTTQLEVPPIGTRPPYMNTNQMGMPRPMGHPPLPPNPPPLPYRQPMPPFSNPNPIYNTMRQTSNFVSLIGPNHYPRPMPNNLQPPMYPPPPGPPPNVSLTPPKPQISAPVEDPLNGLSSPPSPNKDHIIVSPLVPASARKVPSKNI